MSKSEDQKLAALVRKNIAKAEKARQKLRKQYDRISPPEPTDQDLATRDFFSEMKRRPF